MLRGNSTFNIDGVAHEIGREECAACSYGVTLGPCSCGGHVHQQPMKILGFDDDDLMMIEKCDRCGK